MRKNMNSRILYEDDRILVCYKPAGFAVQSGQIGRMDMESELKNYLAEKQKALPFLGVIHRLDQPVEGLLVFAKDAQTAAELNRQLTKGEIRKKYYAAVCGKLPDKETLLVDYLIKDNRTGMAKITGKETAGAKKAVLRFTRSDYSEEADSSLAEIEIDTGRFHQIRVQMAHAGFPLLGDQKYGTQEAKKQSEAMGIKNVALCAYKLEFGHPADGKRRCFQIMPQNTAFLYFEKILEKGNSAK